MLWYNGPEAIIFSPYAKFLAANAKRCPTSYLSIGCRSKGSPTSIVTAIAVLGKARAFNCPSRTQRQPCPSSEGFWSTGPKFGHCTHIKGKSPIPHFCRQSFIMQGNSVAYSFPDPPELNSPWYHITPFIDKGIKGLIIALNRLVGPLFPPFGLGGSEGRGELGFGFSGIGSPAAWAFFTSIAHSFCALSHSLPTVLFHFFIATSNSAFLCL